MSKTDEGIYAQNDVLAHVLLLESSLIELRGYYLQRDGDGMGRALEAFIDRANLFYRVLGFLTDELKESCAAHMEETPRADQTSE